MSALTQTQHCPLLDLPVEILQRITDLLDTYEALPAARRSCKTLDSITFERLASASFATITCCIFYEARWLRLKEILGGPSRVTSRIRTVVFTTCFSEHRGHGELQLAPTKAEADYSLNYAQRQATSDHKDTEAAAVQYPPNLPLMTRVLRDIKQVLPPHVVTLHLEMTESKRNCHIDGHRNALLTLASAQAGLCVRGLSLSERSIWELGESFAHLREDMLRCTAELQGFKLEGNRGEFERLDIDSKPSSTSTTF